MLYLIPFPSPCDFDMQVLRCQPESRSIPKRLSKCTIADMPHHLLCFLSLWHWSFPWEPLLPAYSKPPMSPTHHPYIPSHSSSSSSPCCSLNFLNSSSLSFFLFRSLSARSARSSGHVPFTNSHGRMHWRSKMWSGWQGSWTSKGCGSEAKVLEQMGHVGSESLACSRTVLRGIRLREVM